MLYTILQELLRRSIHEANPHLDVGEPLQEDLKNGLVAHHLASTEGQKLTELKKVTLESRAIDPNQKV